MPFAAPLSTSVIPPVKVLIVEPTAPLGAPASSATVSVNAVSASTGASLTVVIVTVVLPEAPSTPPVPCDPSLPSPDTQLITTDDGGASLLLEYAMLCTASFTRAEVALWSKVINKVPPLLVVTYPMVTPESTRLVPSISGLRLPVAENTSFAFGPPLRSNRMLDPK